MSAPAESRLFDPRLIAAMLVAGLVAFGLFLVLLAYSADFRSGRDGRPHALSMSAVGFHGVVKLIAASGGRVETIRSAADLSREDLVVATIEPGTSADALEDFIAERDEGATLLVLPKWEVAPHPLKKGWVHAAGRIPPSRYARLLEKMGVEEVGLARPAVRTGRGRDWAEGLRAPLPLPVQTVKGKTLQPVLATDEGDMVVAQVGEGALYVLADPDLLNNKGMRDPAVAKGALDLLTMVNWEGAESVSFDLTLNGFESRPNLLKLAFEPPFLPLTIAIVFAAMLAGLHGANRFGPERREPRAIAFGKAALVENSAALFRVARREHSTGAAYAEAIREAAARESGAHLALAERDLDAYLDRVSPPG
ncbi:MAG: hypothetical protein ACK40O_00570, partial [Allosphingosinicella sp.]